MRIFIHQYNFIKEDELNLINPGEDIKRIGPTAQDFYKLFNLGGNDTSIRSADMAGVALAGIKALNQKKKEEKKVDKSTTQKTPDEPLIHKRKKGQWDSFSCSCGDIKQISPLFNKDKFLCSNCGRTIVLEDG